MVTIDYFSDVLCIWAYSGQVRVDELEKHFGDKIALRYRFIPIFGAASRSISKQWSDKGGFDGFNNHLMSVASGWSHINCSEQLWKQCRPATSISAHAILKATWLYLEQQGELLKQGANQEQTLFETLMWNIRRAFFEQARDISHFSELRKLVDELGIPWDDVYAFIEDGQAHAELFTDQELQKKYCVQGSPSFVLNEGRQVLYGNVGYRIVEANIAELLNREKPLEGASWC